MFKCAQESGLKDSPYLYRWSYTFPVSSLVVWAVIGVWEAGGLIFTFMHHHWLDSGKSFWWITYILWCIISDQILYSGYINCLCIKFVILVQMYHAKRFKKMRILQSQPPSTFWEDFNYCSLDSEGKANQRQFSFATLIINELGLTSRAGFLEP